MPLIPGLTAGTLLATSDRSCTWLPTGWITTWSVCRSLSRRQKSQSKKTNISEICPNEETRPQVCSRKILNKILIIQSLLLNLDDSKINLSFFQACCWLMAPPLTMYCLLRGIASQGCFFINERKCIKTFLIFSGFTWQYPRLYRVRQPVLGAIYEEPRWENGIINAVPYTEHATRKTVRASVLYAEVYLSWVLMSGAMFPFKNKSKWLMYLWNLFYALVVS